MRKLFLSGALIICTGAAFAAENVSQPRELQCKVYVSQSWAFETHIQAQIISNTELRNLAVSYVPYTVSGDAKPELSYTLDKVAADANYHPNKPGRKDTNRFNISGPASSDPERMVYLPKDLTKTSQFKGEISDRLEGTGATAKLYCVIK